MPGRSGHLGRFGPRLACVVVKPSVKPLILGVGWSHVVNLDSVGIQRPPSTLASAALARDDHGGRGGGGGGGSHPKCGVVQRRGGAIAAQGTFMWAGRLFVLMQHADDALPPVIDEQSRNLLTGLAAVNSEHFNEAHRCQIDNIRAHVGVCLTVIGGLSPAWCPSCARLLPRVDASDLGP